MKQGKIETLLVKYPIEKLLSDIKYTLDNNGSYKDCKKLWSTFFFGIGQTMPCPSLRTLKRYFSKKQAIQETKGYITVLEEGLLSHVHRNIITGDARNDKSKYVRPDTT